MMISDGVRRKVLADYTGNDLTVKEISKKHKVSIATVTNWARLDGLSRRKKSTQRFRVTKKTHGRK